MTGLQFQIAFPGNGNFQLQASATLPATGVTAIYGPSGSGKSTLLDCIAGLRQPAANSTLTFRNHNWISERHFVPPWQRGIGYVFQDARLFPHLNVAQNLDYALRRKSNNKGPGVDEVIHWLDLGHLQTHAATDLSGGERQRVAIARALLSAPQLLLLDEPLANLDHQSSQQCLHYLQQLTGELDIPVLYVSHDIEEVSQLADYLLLLDNGRVCDQGPLLDLCGRLNTRLSQEEQAAAILVGTIGSDDKEYGLTELIVEGQTMWVAKQHKASGQQSRLRIPARDVSVCRDRPKDSSILNILPVTLTEIDSGSGTRVMLRLALGSQNLLARITRKSAMRLQLQPGDQLYAQIKSAALLLGSAK